MGYFDTRPIQPIGSGDPGGVVSLVNPQIRDDSDAQRAIADLKDSNGEPATAGPGSTPAYGFSTRNGRFLHIDIFLKDVGTDVEWKLWTRKRMSDQWSLDTRPGSSGVVALAESDDDNPQNNIIEIVGIDFVYLEVVKGSGTFTNGVDAWLGASTF